MKFCRQCKNRGKKRMCKYYTGMSNYAEKCKDFEEKKRTNANKIRSMSDEELAEFIINNCDNPISQKNDDMCDYCEKYEDEKTAECDREGCKKAIAKWLQSEVEENQMNDRYLYRAKRTDNGEWVEGNPIWSYDADDDYKAIIIPTTDSNMFTRGGARGDLGFENWFRVDPSTICQCTGLKDKNGKLIWENDIIEAWSQGRCAIGKIKHRIDGTWIMYPAWQKGEMWYLLPNDDGITTVEVIGNIFDNPELLEVGE